MEIHGESYETTPSIGDIVRYSYSENSNKWGYIKRVGLLSEQAGSIDGYYIFWFDPSPYMSDFLHNIEYNVSWWKASI
jgi:hypothetical protein